MMSFYLQITQRLLHEMIEELQKESINAGLNINIAKMKIMVRKRISDTWKITLNDKEN